jgi:hypothetical protein
LDIFCHRALERLLHSGIGSADGLIGRRRAAMDRLSLEEQPKALHL